MKILFDQWARIQVPGVWPFGQRNPYAYVEDVEAVLGQTVDGLDWRRTEARIP